MISIAHAVAMGTSIAGFSYIGYTAITHFNVQGPLTWAARAVSFAFVLGFFAFVLTWPRASGGWLFLPFHLSAVWLLVKTKSHAPAGQFDLIYSPSDPNVVVTTGPYRMIRHPFYTSYVLYWIGNALAASHWATWAAVLVIAGFLFVAARREERNFLNSPLADAYSRYREQSWMFIPYVL